MLDIQSEYYTPRCEIKDQRNIIYINKKVNPLTTDDECTRHATLAPHYQLAQSVLKIGFALAKKVG